ncbi:MAG TPA: SAM-dependent methyltransferase [Bacteroidetes bacterium]|nr:SAM-dependent methyltransferase [Bacteroidota bacterium]
MKGKLYLIPTTLGDFDTMEQVLPGYNRQVLHGLTVFMVENVRTSRRFIKKTGHPAPIDEMTFIEIGKHATISQAIADFKRFIKQDSVGLLSEAGTPCIADPGALIVQAAHEDNIEVVSLVGPNSIILALMASGFNGQRFAFHGYLPVDRKQLAQKIRNMENKVQKDGQTQIFIETPFRNRQLYELLLRNCNPSTKLCIAVNLTLPGQMIRTLTIGAWKKQTVDLNKKPAVFLISK